MLNQQILKLQKPTVQKSVSSEFGAPREVQQRGLVGPRLRWELVVIAHIISRCDFELEANVFQGV